MANDNQSRCAMTDQPTREHQIMKYLAETFGCPCNFSPIDEQMKEICGDICQMEDDAECWHRVMEKLAIKGD